MVRGDIHAGGKGRELSSREDAPRLKKSEKFRFALQRGKIDDIIQGHVKFDKRAQNLNRNFPRRI